MQARFFGLFFLVALFGATPLAASDSCCTDSTCAVVCDGGSVYGMTFFHAREPGSDSALRLIGVADKMNLWEKECQFYGVFSIAAGYEFSRNGCSLGQYFAFDPSGVTKFSSDQNNNVDDNGFYVTDKSTATNALPGIANGSQIDAIAVNMVPADLNSDARSVDFLLPGGYQANLTFDPRVRKGVFDFDLFLGLDEFFNGLWFRASAPIVYASFNMRPCEKELAAGAGTFYGNGWIDAVLNEAETLLVADDGTIDYPYTSIVDAWQNLGAAGDVQASGCGKLACGSVNKTRVAEVDLSLGYDIIRNCTARLGAALYAVLPTGNTPNAKYLFEPLAGAYNWQLGATVGLNWNFWNCDDNQSLTLYGYGIFTHLFERKQTRLLGLNVGGTTAGNSWVLLKKFNPADGGAYSGEIIRASSALGRQIKVGNDFMVDLSFMLQYRRCAFDFSVGYNFWYRSKDHANNCDGQNAASCNGCYAELEAGTYGIKGAAPAAYNTNGTPGLVQTLFYDKRNSNIAKSGTLSSSAAFAEDGDDPQGIVGDISAADPAAYVLESDICTEVALHPSAYSNKVFGYLGYNWEDCDGSPFLGIGASYEWGESHVALTQIGLYVKGGWSF